MCKFYYFSVSEVQKVLKSRTSFKLFGRKFNLWSWIGPSVCTCYTALHLLCLAFLHCAFLNVSWKCRPCREKAQNTDVERGQLHGQIEVWKLELVKNMQVFLFFLDAIASYGSHPCKWVIDSFRCDAIASPSFASLLLKGYPDESETDISP